MISIPRAIVYIDLNILENNLREIKSKLHPDVKVLCVVKADAYGHGASEVARRLESNNVDYLGVATMDEGIELRENGVQTPILVLSGILPWDEIEPALKNNLTCVVYDFDSLKRIREASGNFDGILKIHIKIDTGMGRLGFEPAETGYVAEYLNGIDNIEVEGLMSHFSSSEKRDEYGIKQVKRFEEALTSFREGGITPGITHMANSGAVISYPEAHMDMVRLGITLYGSYPGDEIAEKLTIEPVMKFVSKVAFIKQFPEGSPLSYGRTYTTAGPTKVAYVPVGYADGYPRLLSNKGSVLIKDTRCSIIGRICMDWFLVDVTELEEVEAEEEVIVMGKGNTDTITPDELAKLAQTIPYEIVCKVSKRVMRVYV